MKRPRSPLVTTAPQAVDGLQNDIIQAVGMPNTIYTTEGILSKFVVDQYLEAIGLVDPRAEAIEALDEMITVNVELDPRKMKIRPWITVNSGIAASGKSTMLELSCNHFVGEGHPLIRRHRRCAIYITFNGRDVGSQGCDAAMPPQQRVYNRILFALCGDDDRALGLHAFVQSKCKVEFGAADVVARIREVCGEHTHVLIAADELRICAGHVTGYTHAVQEKCVEAISGLNALVRWSFTEAAAGRIYVVASVYAAVDLKTFSTQSLTPFTLQPMLPIALRQLQTALRLAGVDPKKRRDEDDLALFRGLLACSTHPSCLALVLAFCEKTKEKLLEQATRPYDAVEITKQAKQQLTAELKGFAEFDKKTTYVNAVCNRFRCVDDVVVAIDLLKLLFRATPHSARHQFSSALAPACDAMCYDMCRIVRTSNCDTVLMRPAEIVKLSTSVLEVLDDTPADETNAALAATSRDRAFVKAVNDFGVAMQALVANPIGDSGSGDNVAGASRSGMGKDGKVSEPHRDVSFSGNTASSEASGRRESGKAFETLIKCLFRCVLLAGNRKGFLRMFDAVGSGNRDFDYSCGAVSSDRLVPDVNDVVAFPRAYEKALGRNVERTAGIVEKMRAPCVCAPSDTHNVLLDVAVLVPRPNAKPLCLALQMKEHSANSIDTLIKDVVQENARKKNVLETWRDRTYHLTFEEYGDTRREIEHFRGENDFLWVLVTVNKAPGLRLESDEALLSLEGAMAWCPSLRFAESAIAVWKFYATQ